MERVYNAEDVEDIRPYPDALHTLRELRQAGYKLFLVTLGRARRQRNKIERLGIAPYFDRIINEGPPAHAYWFSELMESHDLSPDQLVVVGDRTHDEIRAGNRQGLTTVWLRRGRFSHETPALGDRPDYEIKYLAQLSTLLHLSRIGKTPDRFRIAVIGGGTGLPTVLSGLRPYTRHPTAVVAVTDTGASSGRIRWNLEYSHPATFATPSQHLPIPNRYLRGFSTFSNTAFPTANKNPGSLRTTILAIFSWPRSPSNSAIFTQR